MAGGAQGPEFDRVRRLPAKPNRVLTRELLYTVVTRSRSAVTIVAGPEVLEKAIASPVRVAGSGYVRGPHPDDLKLEKVPCLGPLAEGEREMRHLSDDQAICAGCANSIAETHHMPPAEWLARRIARALVTLRLKKGASEVGPDGKVIVRVETDSAAWEPVHVPISLNHPIASDWMFLRRIAEEPVAAPHRGKRMPKLELDGAGMFIAGGPNGDNGQTGKKLVADTCGPTVPIGGGAWSGNDFNKVDRAGGVACEIPNRWQQPAAGASMASTNTPMPPASVYIRCARVRALTSDKSPRPSVECTFAYRSSGSGPWHAAAVALNLLVEISRMKTLLEQMLECRSINECIDLALVDACGVEEQAAAWLTCIEEMFSRFEQVELMGRQVTLEGFDLAHGQAIVAICKEGKKSARVAIESIRFAGMTPVESRWLKAWKKFSKTV